MSTKFVLLDELTLNTYILIKIILNIMIFTGKSFSEALILASTTPQYDKRLLMNVHVQYMKIENYKLSTCCVHRLF